MHATVYNINPDHGAFVAVEDQFLGRIPKREIHNKIVIGEQLNLRVTKVNEDGKLSLSPHEKAYLQIDRDAKLIMELPRYFFKIPLSVIVISPSFNRRPTARLKAALLSPSSRSIVAGLALSLNGRRPS